MFPQDDAVPRDSGLKDEVQKRQMEFYPMVPFILLILACLLKMPNFLWTAFQVSRASVLLPYLEMLDCLPGQYGFSVIP